MVTTKIFTVMQSLFEMDDWPVTKIDSKNILEMDFQGTYGQWQCYAEAREAQAQFLFYSILSVQVPVKRRLAMAEFITRANYGITIGNFELDMDDGEVRYKTSLDVEHTTLTTELIKQHVYLNVRMMDTYFLGILSVLEGELLPTEAIAMVEKR